ncbi:methylthioribulose-1-phosphate dehydratase [Sporothrix schenckii 1099-18]|uniref:Methylthioribulose-1-phosphate dehydratase n=1 Tax=Sporothrix schenckii 1099-18 TaxID=1397361 RepID=A0A0F2M385_SPOSC|nr:methylthioribulose-1-phosphate dehydratase [Sporothrix schenckii 1099-18]KJR82601.1 methylthioribulose-1-phosphate dehydratase [Sporothrix schenckii 1099-18]
MSGEASATSDGASNNNEQLVISIDPKHPANLVPSLCAKFWTLGWVTGTGGGASIRDGPLYGRSAPNKLLQRDLVYIAPSGVQKELMKNTDIYVMSLEAQAKLEAEQKANGTYNFYRPERTYLRSPVNLKPSQCTPLFLAAFTKRKAGCCIHTHSQWAVLVTLLLEQDGRQGGNGREFCINNVEQIKGFRRGYQKTGNMGYHDTLRIPVIENTPQEEDLTPFLEEALDEYPDTYAVLVRRHGVYVWGDTPDKAKVVAECYDYLFQLAVEMRKLGLPWVSDIKPVDLKHHQ